MDEERGGGREGAGNKMTAASDDNDGGERGCREKNVINVRIFKSCSTSA